MHPQPASAAATPGPKIKSAACRVSGSEVIDLVSDSDVDEAPPPPAVFKRQRVHSPSASGLNLVGAYRSGFEGVPLGIPTPAQAPGKQPAEAAAHDEPAATRIAAILEDMSGGQVDPDSTHPSRELERLLRSLASEKLRDHPTLPPGACLESADAGEAWQRVHCSFLGCSWTSDGAEEELQRHISEAHTPELEPLRQHMIVPDAPDAAYSLYCEAIAIKCRADAPIAGCSLDRKALRSFAAATAGDNVEALVCCVCACIHTRVAETEQQGDIAWHRPLRPKPSSKPLSGPSTAGVTFLGRPTQETADLLGLEAFLQKYDGLEGGAKLTEFEDFASIPGPERPIPLLCCPEDHRCRAHPEHVTSGVLCEDCEVPLCNQCHDELRQGRLPPRSLANDMFTGYAPERLYSEQVTVMEMICASPCITALICMSMEAKYHSNATLPDGPREGPLDAQAHMARHRFGARGNALTFPLPWEDLLQHLQAQPQSTAPLLPRTGDELADTVRVLLKTNKSGKTTEAEIKSLIHQAKVRRRVVVDLIMDMKRLGHPSFQQLQEDAVQLAASSLPEDGIPPQVLKVGRWMTRRRRGCSRRRPPLRAMAGRTWRAPAPPSPRNKREPSCPRGTAPTGKTRTPWPWRRWMTCARKPLAAKRRKRKPSRCARAISSSTNSNRCISRQPSASSSSTAPPARTYSTRPRARAASSAADPGTRERL